MAHGFRYPETGNQVGHGLFVRAALGQVRGVFHHFRAAVAQLADDADLQAFIGLDMSAHDAFLRMPQSKRFGNGDYVFELVHVQVTPRSVVIFQQRKGGFVPALEHFGAAGIVRIEIDAAFCAADGRAGHAEFNFHDLGQGSHLVAGQPFTHARAAAGRTAAQGVDDDPAFGLGFGVVPFKNDFRLFVFVLL